jgi:hypothetical protein
MGWRTGVPRGRTGCCLKVTRTGLSACPISARSGSKSGGVLRMLTPGGGGWGPPPVTTPMGWGIEGSAGIPSTPSVGPGRSTDVRGDEGWQCQACRRAGPRTNPVDRDGGDRWLPKTVRAVGGQQDLLSDARTICPLMASSSRSVLASGTAALAGAGHRLALWRYPAASYAM